MFDACMLSSLAFLLTSRILHVTYQENRSITWVGQRDKLEQKTQCCSCFLSYAVRFQECDNEIIQIERYTRRSSRTFTKNNCRTFHQNLLKRLSWKKVVGYHPPDRSANLALFIRLRLFIRQCKEVKLVLMKPKQQRIRSRKEN